MFRSSCYDGSLVTIYLFVLPLFSKLNKLLQHDDPVIFNPFRDDCFLEEFRVFVKPQYIPDVGVVGKIARYI